MKKWETIIDNTSRHNNSMKKEKINLNAFAFEKMQIKSECFLDSYLIQTSTGIDYRSFVKEQLCFQLISHIYKMDVDEKIYEIDIDRPKFFDWLFRRRKKIKINVKATDVLDENLLNIKYDAFSSIRLYDFTKLD